VQIKCTSLDKAQAKAMVKITSIIALKSTKHSLTSTTNSDSPCYVTQIVSRLDQGRKITQKSGGDRVGDIWRACGARAYNRGLGAVSHFSNRHRFFKTSHKHKAVNLARKLCCCNLATWLFANSSPHKPTQACPMVSYSNKRTSQY